jgi:hypothetical protein
LWGEQEFLWTWISNGEMKPNSRTKKLGRPKENQQKKEKKEQKKSRTFEHGD